MHVRQLVREAAERTLTGLPTTGDRVFKHPYALRDGDYPALKVTTMDESSSAIASYDFGPALSREIDLVVEVWAVGRDELEDHLDQIALEVEEAIAFNFTLDGTAGDAVLASTAKTVDPGGDRRGGRLTLTYTVRVVTAPGDPSKPL